LNRIAAPWEFIERTDRGEALDTELEQIRSLYAGEVAAPDHHLRQLVEYLKKNDHFEDTILIVTSDHGENLGETDFLGNRRMGHEASISEPLLRVPLMVVHPDMEPRSVSKPISNRRIFDFLTGLFGTEHTDVRAAEDAFVTDGPVCVEYPATGGNEIYNRHPNVSREALGLRTSVHHSVAIDEDWLTIADSTGQRLAFENSTEQDYRDAPAALRKSCEENLTRMFEAESDDSELS
jgi:arylsulfatase A-like enzyme